MNEKTCPLSFHTVIDREGTPMLLKHNCFKEDCAWWIKEYGMCGIMAAATTSPYPPFIGKNQ